MEFFGQVRENSGKDHSQPQNFACSYSYVLHHHRFRDFLECFGTRDFWSCICESTVADTTCIFFYTHSTYTLLYNVLLQ